MFSEGKIIYSRRFPRLAPEEFAVALQNEPKPDQKPSVPPMTAMEFLEHIQKKTTYVPNKEKIKACPYFIRLAKAFSLEFEVDMKITEFPHRVCVNMQLDFTDYMGAVKNMLIELLTMADHIGFFRCPWDSNSFTVSLEYRTYDQYRNGHKID